MEAIFRRKVEHFNLKLIFSGNVTCTCICKFQITQEVRNIRFIIKGVRLNK